MHSPKLSSRSRGFTLIELLTVIAIIAILMALLFPALAGAKNQARNAQAGNDVQATVTAVKSYFTEYGKFPDVAAAGAAAPAGGGNATDALVGDEAASIPGAPNRLLFSTLRSISADANDKNVQNPRKISFFEGKRASNPTSPKAGFQDSPTGNAAVFGCFFDPWGKQYNVVMDTNF